MQGHLRLVRLPILYNHLMAFRDFITSTTITVLVDLPFVCLYLLVIYSLGGNLVIVPLCAMPVVFLLGIVLQSPLSRLTKSNFALSSEKAGNTY